jgi:hypothetical protein
MRSKWFELKPKATSLRRQGKSIRYIEKNLSIPRSTLSGWFKNIKLTTSQYKLLNDKHKNALIKARKLAILWHNKQKLNRLKFAEDQADNVLKKINNKNETIELALALLYLGEGFKKSPRTGMGNSDPLLLKFFLKIILNVYKINIKNISCELHIRADQNPKSIKKYWAKELSLPLNKFKSISIDKRTIGKTTYSNYKGVCVIGCGNIAIQRKLVYIGNKFCKKVVEELGG